MVGRGARPPLMDVGHHTEPVELLEVAVDGREVDVGRFRLLLRGDVLGGGPVARRGE